MLAACGSGAPGDGDPGPAVATDDGTSRPGRGALVARGQLRPGRGRDDRHGAGRDRGAATGTHRAVRPQRIQPAPGHLAPLVPGGRDGPRRSARGRDGVVVPEPVGAHRAVRGTGAGSGPPASPAAPPPCPTSRSWSTAARPSPSARSGSPIAIDPADLSTVGSGDGLRRHQRQHDRPSQDRPRHRAAALVRLRVRGAVPRVPGPRRGGHPDQQPTGRPSPVGDDARLRHHQPRRRVHGPPGRVRPRRGHADGLRPVLRGGAVPLGPVRRRPDRRPAARRPDLGGAMGGRSSRATCTTPSTPPAGRVDRPRRLPAGLHVRPCQPGERLHPPPVDDRHHRDPRSGSATTSSTCRRRTCPPSTRGGGAAPGVTPGWPS